MKLSWITTNEVNTRNFLVERSVNGTFESIGSVSSKNTSGEHSYTFVDNSPVNGTNYYRLKQVDNDGSFKYSATVFAEGKGCAVLSAYPNPVTGSSFTVSYPEAIAGASLKIMTLAGNQVGAVNVASGSINSNVDVSSLVAGYYVIVYQNGTEKTSLKFVKQ